ncbi:protein tweety homolog 1-like isoform X2 [Watersipora subatra]|uniref:protein tweety homolog 1-like isoform X2 n=1 Tax=Watersipora subatra TaxID=2589382 RepID=UPI00355C5797
MADKTVTGLPLELIKFFHSFPHYDIKFSPVSSEFDPDDKQYRESLLLIAAVPVLWMLLWIIIYMVYFCYFCMTCRKSSAEKAHKSDKPARWCSFIFAIFTILVLAIAIFGNEVVSYSLKEARSDAGKISDGMDDSVMTTARIRGSLDILENGTAIYLESSFKTNNRLDQDARPMLIGLTSMLRDALVAAALRVQKDLQQPLVLVQFDDDRLSDTIEEYEVYRRVASNAAVGFLLVTIALALCALGSKKKAFLLACVAIFIFNLMLVWVGAGLYASLVVASSDFCTDPPAYFAGASDSPEVAAGVIRYLECKGPTNSSNEAIIAVHHQLEEADSSLASMESKGDLLASEVLLNISAAREMITKVKLLLVDFSSTTDCTSAHESYMAAIANICSTSILAEVAVLASFTLVGLFIIVLIFLLHAAARFSSSGSQRRKAPALNVTTQPVSRRRRRAYFEVDSQDNDFQSRGENTRSDNPLYYRFSQISTNDDNTRVVATTSASDDPQPSAPPRSSPPPANHKDFYSTYGNNGTLDSNTRVPAASNDLNRNSNTFRT